MKKQVLLFEEVQKLNKQNAEKSDHQLATGDVYLECGVSPNNQQPVAHACNLVDYLCEDSQVAVTEKHEVEEEVIEEEPGQTVPEEETGNADMENEAKEEEKLEVFLSVSVVKEAAGDKKETTSTRYSLCLSPVGTGIIRSFW